MYGKFEHVFKKSIFVNWIIKTTLIKDEEEKHYVSFIYISKCFVTCYHDMLWTKEKISMSKYA